MADRPDIRRPMKRVIRKRCGAGCVVCGKPIYEYHHIYGFKHEIGHIEAEITLLCDSCHRKEMGGLISRDMILDCNNNPWNLKTGVSTPDRIWYAKSFSKIVLGSCSAFGAPFGYLVPLRIDGLPVIELIADDGEWMLNLRLLDFWNRPMITVNENELSYTVLDDLDIEYVGGTLKMSAKRRTFFEASFTPPTLEIRYGLFSYNGIHIDISPEMIFLINNKSAISGMTWFYSQNVLSYGDDPSGQPAAFANKVPARLALTANGEVKVTREQFIEWIQSSSGKPTEN